MDERDPDRLLAGYRYTFDPDTLREVLDEAGTALFHEIRASLTSRLAAVDRSGGDDRSRARLLSLRAAVARVLRDLGPARADGIRALAYAESVGDLGLLSTVRCRLAHVLQWLGEFESADRLFALADSPDLPDRARAGAHQHAGKCAFDQGRYIEAVNHFERALELRRDDPDPGLLASTEVALDSVFRRVAEHGWGPYARSRDEILGTRAAPEPLFEEYWGYGVDGVFTLDPRYDSVEPFSEGVAWVLFVDEREWSLIDETGAVVVRASGFDEVRPFRRGLAAVARDGRWGAVDPAGTVIVPLEFDGFATAMHDGRYVEGFSESGYAVVRRHGRLGVVDHTGGVLVPTVYAAVVVHPVAFLVTDGLRWGALDRRGDPLIDLVHPSRTSLDPLLVRRRDP